MMIKRGSKVRVVKMDTAGGMEKPPLFCDKAVSSNISDEVR
jgi:hypothetical protein